MKKIFACLIALMTVSIVPAFANENITQTTQQSITALEPRDWGGIGLGADKAWRIKPGFQFKTAYDSNIYREKSGNRNEDVIFSYTPSIAVRRAGSKVQVESSYEFDFDEYIRQSKQNAFNHRVGNKIDYTGERLSAHAGDYFGSVKAYATSEQSKFRSIVYNNLDSEVKYKLTPKFSVSGLFNNDLFQYRDTEMKQYSYMEYTYGGRVYFHMRPKLDVYLQGTGTNVNYYRSGLYDSAGGSAVIGAIGEISQKLTLSLNTGYKGRGYTKEINSYNDWIGEGILRYRATPKTAMTLSAKRDLGESVYANEGYYRVNRFDFDVDYNLTRLLLGKAGVGFQNNRYPTKTTVGVEEKKRHDNITSTSVRLIYGPFHHISLAAGYAFRTRLSNFASFDYVDHLVDSSIAYQF